MPWHSKPYDTADGRSVVRIYEDVGDAVPYSRLLTPTEARALAADLVRAADAVEPMVERSCYTCAYNKNAVCYHPPDELEMAIDQYAVDAGCATNDGGLPTDRSIPCPGHAREVTS